MNYAVTIAVSQPPREDAPLGKVEAAGGKIIMPKTSIGPNGFMGRFIDTEGNRMSFHSMK